MKPSAIDTETTNARDQQQNEKVDEAPGGPSRQRR
jgi:hypothetical protein